MWPIVRTPRLIQCYEGGDSGDYRGIAFNASRPARTSESRTLTCSTYKNVCLESHREWLSGLDYSSYEMGREERIFGFSANLILR